MDKKIKVFLINLDRSNERLVKFTENAKKRGLNFERISAIDGKGFSGTDNIEGYDHALNMKRYPKQLGPGEIACFQSHIKVWERTLEEDLDFAVILEDDAEIKENFFQAIEDIVCRDVRWDYIKLCEKPEKRKALAKKKVGEHHLVVYNKIPAGTTAQLVSKNGVRKLLAGSKRIARPVDIDIQYWWEYEINVYGLKPYPVDIDTTLESEINKLEVRNKQSSNKLLRIVNSIKYTLINFILSRKFARKFSNI